MSLKAKIEAVIYAAEEPVTLAQLTGLLGQEAQAELEALDSRQESLPLTEDAEAAEADQEASTDRDPEALNAKAPGEAAGRAESAAALSAEAEPAQTSAEANERAASEFGDANADEPAPAVASEAAPAPAGDAAPAPANEAAAQRARERRLRDYFRHLLEELTADYAGDDRGLEIREVAGGFRFATKPEYHDAVRGFVKSLKPPLKLSLQALETLAVVAYKQPITAPEVSEIRGVDSAGVLGSLMARKLVATAGRKQVIGRPILYKTTKEFLLRFGLKDLNELPSIEEFEKMAGEFADAQEEIPMAGEEAVRRSEEDASAEAHESQPDDQPYSQENPYSEENLSGEDPRASVVDPADNVEVDGRVSGVPPNYERADYVEGDEVDTPAIDAEVQSNEKTGGA